MPVRRRIGLLEDVQIKDLRDRLIREFRDPQEDEPEPVIVEDQGIAGGLRLYVIWGRWGDLEQRVRSEVVLDAFREVRGVIAAREVTVAMGLTQPEAQRMNIRYA